MCSRAPKRVNGPPRWLQNKVWVAWVTPMHKELLVFFTPKTPQTSNESGYRMYFLLMVSHIQNQFFPPSATDSEGVEFHMNTIDTRFQDKMIDNCACRIWFQHIAHFTHSHQKKMAANGFTKVAR